MRHPTHRDLADEAWSVTHIKPPNEQGIATTYQVHYLPWYQHDIHNQWPTAIHLWDDCRVIEVKVKQASLHYLHQLAVVAVCGNKIES